MKKLFLLIAVLCAAVATQAQVISAYTMQATEGTYTEITEGIAMDTIGLRVEEGLNEKAWYPTGIVSEMATAPGFPIGFDFEFNDIICNQFVIGSHGYIAIGRDEITLNPSEGKYLPIREEGADNLIGIFVNTMGGIWCLETTEISYQVIGEAPARTLVVQFKDLGVNMGWDAESVAKVNLQLRLNETSNTIEMVFGNFDYKEDATKQTRFALRGYYEDNLSLIEGEEPGMLNYVAVAGDELAPFGSGTVAGTTFTFTPPAECVAPLQAVSNFTVNATSKAITGSFEPVTDADHYLILMSKNAKMATPVDGTQYKLGEYIGETLVYDYTTETTFNSEDWITSDWENLILDPATEYHFAVYAANSLCTRGPKYSVAATYSVSTKPAAPANIAITNTTLNSLTFDVEANGTDNVIVLLTDKIIELEGNFGFVYDFGEPNGLLNVGDIVDDKGIVVYKGASTQGVVVDDLAAGTTYCVRAYSYNDKDEYSTDVVEAANVTVSVLPWSLDLTMVELGSVPCGWESIGLNDGNNWTVANSSMGYGDEEKQLYTQTFPNVETGHIAELTTPRILIDKRDALFTFEYCMYIWSRFGGNLSYDAWEANDKLAVLVSRNGGEFEEVHTITAENFVVPDSANQFIPVNVDLSEYVNDEVRIRIHWECFSGSQIRMPLEGWMIDGRPIPVIPEVTVSGITWNSANVSWRGEQETYEFAYAKVGEEFVASVVNEKSVILTDLTHLTDYQVKVRGIVAEGDTTDWCEVVTFTTADLPVCPIPDGLAHVETDDYGDKLTWNINEEHLSWDLRYRESSATAWTDVEGLYTNEYVLYNLVPGSAYLWRVRAYCDMERVSQYASQETFNANGQSAISAADTDRLAVVAGNGVINIFNSDVYVESVALLDMQGRVIANYNINGRDNIVIPTDTDGVLIVVVNTVDKQLVYKVRK